MISMRFEENTPIPTLKPLLKLVPLTYDLFDETLWYRRFRLCLEIFNMYTTNVYNKFYKILTILF